MRYKKQKLVKQIAEKEELLRDKTVTIVGLGGVGSVLADMFVRSGINVRIVDRGRVESEDLQKLALFSEDDVSKFKVKQAKKILEKINPKLKIKAFHEDLSSDNMFLIDADIVIDATNELSLSLQIDKYCAKKKIPLIFTHVAGSRGGVYLTQKTKTLSDISDYLKEHFSQQEGILSQTVHGTAAIAASKTFKVLLGEKVAKSVLFFDIWDYSIDTEIAKKNKK
ncbi:MAG: ThiF family adenylyltransferase [Candidatus Woesearchaeota archaeon]|nr:MAG: ThiF family adenylyltransferase [Candidatus Woesearchaeota archaeon]